MELYLLLMKSKQVEEPQEDFGAMSIGVKELIQI